MIRLIPTTPGPDGTGITHSTILFIRRSTGRVLSTPRTGTGALVLPMVSDRPSASASASVLRSAAIRPTASEDLASMAEAEASMAVVSATARRFTARPLTVQDTAIIRLTAEIRLS